MDILRLHVAYHDHTQTGQLMSRASSYLLQIQGFVVMIPITASNLMMVATIVVVLAVQQPLLALIALAPLPFLNVLATRFSRERRLPALLSALDCPVGAAGLPAMRARELSFEVPQ